MSTTVVGPAAEVRSFHRRLERGLCFRDTPGQGKRVLTLRDSSHTRRTSRLEHVQPERGIVSAHHLPALFVKAEDCHSAAKCTGWNRARWNAHTYVLPARLREVECLRLGTTEHELL